MEIPEAFGSPGGEAARDSRWWSAFGDPQLDRWVALALGGNPTLAGAWERLRAARAVADRAGAALSPEIDGFFEGETTDPGGAGGDSLRLGLAAAYEVDLWGGIEAAADAERLRAEASLFDYRAAAISLAAEVTTTWFRLLESRGQEEILRGQIASNEDVLELLEVRLGTGQVGAADVLRQEQLLESTREELLAVESRTAVLDHQMAVLLGRTPQRGIDYRAVGLPSPGSAPETGVPAGLVRRRPDVRAAFERLRAADREVAAAVSERYPRLTVSGSVATGGEEVGDLFTEWIRTLAGGLVAPLLDGGARAAEVRRTEAVAATRLFEYARAILGSLREVEDALAREAFQRRRIASLRRQRSLAEETLKRLRMEFFNGVGDYIDVLVAQTEEKRVQRELLRERRVLLEFRVALYRALAGTIPTGRENPGSGDERNDHG